MPQLSDLDYRAIAMARALAADSVQNVGNGHPGTAMALAPAAYLLFQHHLRHDPKDPDWQGRDRFVLSIGHSSLTLYTQLFLSGYGLEIEDFRNFRQARSKTPGHPEYGHTAGVETTTGPLGQGIANAVGIALGAKHRAALTASVDFNHLFDQQVYVLAGDGCLQEGISAEAASLAGHLKLNNLILIYDDNKISIDGSTELAFTEDVCARFKAYGWEVYEVAKKADGDIDIAALDAALTAARQYTLGPVLIRMESTIGFPAPNSKGQAKAHGAALGAAEVAATKVELGLNPEIDFFVDTEALAHSREVQARGLSAHQLWQTIMKDFAVSEPEAFARWDATFKVPNEDQINSFLPQWEIGKLVATRKASGVVLNSIVPKFPVLFGGSADLSESNGTLIEHGGAVSCENYAAANIHFGIREHAMGAIVNGLALVGYRPYAGTFLVFSDYMRGAVRLSALMNLPTTQIWTHDSIGLGEDGPTHQPIEHLAALRLIPNFAVVRPADANETAAAYRHLITNPQPAALALSRQDLPVLVDSATAAQVSKGGYVIHSALQPVITIIATGSEVSISINAAEQLAAAGIATQVVSMPCVSWFEAQSVDYKESVLPAIPTLAVEAGSTAGWYKYADRVVGIDHFGASAAPGLLFTEYGITAANIVAQAKALLGKGD